MTVRVPSPLWRECLYAPSYELPREIVDEWRRGGAAACVEPVRMALAAVGEGEWDETTAVMVEAVREVAWTQLHLGYWRDAPVVWRDVHSHACVLLAYGLGATSEAVRKLDDALLLGAPTLGERLADLADELVAAMPTRGAGGGGALCDNDERDVAVRQRRRSLDRECAIERVESPSVEAFRREYELRGRPVVVTGHCEHWPALARDGERSWNDVSYLKRVAGARTVPVEFGSSYTDDAWAQRLVRFDEFIDRHVLVERGSPPAKRARGPGRERAKAYVAQTRLFEQIPRLDADIDTPLYAAVHDEVERNAWFGPAGTVSPAHWDPCHVLLVQAVGAKYVRLFAPEQSARLYPHASHTMHHNTSRVDVMRPRLEHFPLVAQARYVETVLDEGEMLFIPRHWWHYVESLTPSFSVSFWYERRRRDCCTTSYTRDGRLDPAYLGERAPAPVVECGCCASNAVVGRGSRVLDSLEVYETGDDKGRALRSRVPLARGEFVCEYVGERVDGDEARRRLDATLAGARNFVLAVREHVGSRVVTSYFDASDESRSSVARWVNHSCAPNLVVVPVRVAPESRRVRACLFAARDIAPLEGLTFDYAGGASDEAAVRLLSAVACLCGADVCRGWLPAT